MNHALLMRVVQSETGHEHELHHAVDRQQVVVAAVLLERSAVRVLHDDVVLAALADRVMDRDDMRMLQLAGEGCLGEERALRLLPLLVARHRAGFNNLDRDLPRAEPVVGEIHAAGRTLSEGSDHGVLADTPGNRLTHALPPGLERERTAAIRPLVYEKGQRLPALV